MERRKIILAIDDEEMNLTLIENNFQGVEYDIITALSGEEGLKKAFRHRPDIILLDLMMPDIDGLHVLQELKISDITKDIPVIMLTASDDYESELQCLKFGAIEYINKPIYPELLKQKIKNIFKLPNVKILKDSYDDAINILVNISNYNDLNFNKCHNKQVAKCSKLLSLLCGYDEVKAERIYYASMLHDIGKIVISPEILAKGNDLNNNELNEIKKHVTVGAEFLSVGKSPIFKIASNIAKFHHERWDGTGYPLGVSKRHIPEEARIVCICDYYVSKFSKLSRFNIYKKQQDIINNMKENSGKIFDPNIIDIFIDNIIKFNVQICNSMGVQNESKMLYY